jgi:hypothetical protein
MIEFIEGHCKELERDHLPFDYQAMTADAYMEEGLRELASIGVTEVIVAFRNPYEGGPDTQTVEEKIGVIDWYAQNVIEPYNS